MKIRNDDFNVVLAALMQAVDVAKEEENAAKDDLLFAGIDEKKDSRARASVKEENIKGWFNSKTFKFSNEIGGRPELVKLLNDFLNVAAFKNGGNVKTSLGNSGKQLSLAIIVTLNHRGLHLLGQNLYLKVAILPKRVDENSHVINNDYYFLIDFHD